MTMSNRYEREIEEILRNMEQSQSKDGRPRRKPRPITQRPHKPFRWPSWQLSTAEWWLIALIICALLAGGVEYLAGPNLFSGIIALAGTVCLVLVALSNFIFGRRRPPTSTRYGSITITPLRQPGPFSQLRNRIHLIILKWRYRSKNKE
jgi:hypothetical protein